MTRISSEHLFCLSCWEGNTGATHFRMKIHEKNKTCFLSPILESKLMDLDSESIDVLLGDVESRNRAGPNEYKNTMISTRKLMMSKIEPMNKGIIKNSALYLAIS